MLDDSPSPYRVVISHVVQQGLRSLCQQGPSDQVLAAAHNIMDRLADDPLEFGEPAFHLRQLGLEVRFGVVAPLGVRFAVQQDELVVFVMEFQLLTTD